jgi:formylglycine-generating enzyme required for sulfatase activity
LEWVEDVHGADYENAPADGSAVSSAKGDDRVARGGAWTNPARDLRSGARLSEKPGKPVEDIGFRVVAEL